MKSHKRHRINSRPSNRRRTMFRPMAKRGMKGRAGGWK